MLTKAFIPYQGYYSTPFCRWQGMLSNENAIELGANTAKRWIEKKKWSPSLFDTLFLGITIGQPHHFYAAPWAAALMGADHIPGMTISQACTTGTTALYQAGLFVETGSAQTAFVLTTDRTSNGPHTVWPNPKGPGGEVISENWLMDNFNNDPNVGLKMIETAENVAKEQGFTKEMCDGLTYRRFEQYQMALDNDRTFQKNFMFAPKIRLSRKKTVRVEEDEGIVPTTMEGLSKLNPLLKDGIHSFGAQTHPADGNASIIVTTETMAKELSTRPEVNIRILSYGYAREKRGFMAKAPVPAARKALEQADLSIKEIKVIKTHNPFTVNDLYFAKEMDVLAENFNNYGSSLIYGHPQGSTATRLIIEGIEETYMKGGGYLLWTGCAAGDCGAAIILKID